MTDSFDHEQIAIRCTIMRGGTSKGVFFMRDDLPPPGPQRDRLLKRVMGTPHTMQIDGLGGSNLLTSKIAIIGPPTVPGADVDYTFAQVEIVRDVVDYAGNCGNISAAVGPFAIEAGFVRPKPEITEVRIHNTNTGKVFVSHVPVSNGRPRVGGDLAIPGVPGTGARIFLDYRQTAGAKTGSILPTGRRIDVIGLESGETVETTICDVGNPAVFVSAAAVGLGGSELPAEIDSTPRLLALLREIRGKGALLIGSARDWRRVDDESPLLPFVIIVSEPSDYVGIGGVAVAAGETDLRARMIFMNHCHESMAGTGSMCIGAASRIPGSVPSSVLSPAARRRDTLRIGHPSGSMPVTAKARPADRPEGVEFEGLGFERTARRLLDGTVYVPRADV